MKFRVDLYQDEREVFNKNLLVWGDNETSSKGWNYSTRYSDDIVRTYQANFMFPLFQLDNPKSILVVGIAGGSLVPAIKKIHPNVKITGVDISKDVKAMTAQLGTLQYIDELIIEDGFKFIETTKEQYDAIIIDILIPNVIKEYPDISKNPLEKFTNKSELKPTLERLTDKGLLIVAFEMYEEYSMKLGQEWYINKCDAIMQDTGGQITSLHSTIGSRLYYKDILYNIDFYIKNYNDTALILFKDKSKINKQKIYKNILDSVTRDIALINYAVMFFNWQIFNNKTDIVGGKHNDKYTRKLKEFLKTDEGKKQLRNYMKMEK